MLRHIFFRPSQGSTGAEGKQGPEGTEGEKVAPFNLAL